MIANEVSAAVNIGLALAAIAAMRAYWPRAPLHPGHGPGRTFYFAFLLLGVSVAQNQAGDRERRQQRDRRLSAVRYDALVGHR